MNMSRYAGSASLVAMLLVAPPVAEGQTSDVRSYDMPAQDLGSALRQVGALSGHSVVVATDLVAGLQAPALKGRYTVDDAVAALLRGTRLRAVAVNGALVIERDPGGDSAAADVPGEILVTGTRSLAFVPPIIHTGNPDDAKIRKLVAESLTAAKDTPAPTISASPSASPSPSRPASCPPCPSPSPSSPSSATPACPPSPSTAGPAAPPGVAVTAPPTSPGSPPASTTSAATRPT